MAGAEAEAAVPLAIEELVLRLRILLPPLLCTQQASWEQGVAAHVILACQQFWDRICPPVPQPFDFISLIYALAHESVVPLILPAWGHDILDDRSTFVETNLSQMLTYTIFRLALLRRRASELQLSGPYNLPELVDDEMNGWLHTAEQMRKAAVGKTDGWGFVRDVCGSPRFDKA
ncbi:hypothetical protein EVJ58_g9595, partial [Rhodofomes roseus]